MTTEVTTPATATMAQGAGLALGPQPEDGLQDDGFFGYDAVLRPARGTVVYAATKRCLDIVGACAAIVLVSPLVLVVALWIKLTDFGPVMFCQTRVGRGGRLFKFYKFRSMVPDADRRKRDLAHLNHHADQRTFKMPYDPRVTRVGRFIRRFSIDELPQLWNVLRGDMSLVGPRPPVPDEVELYTRFDRRRFEVKPGLTCIWQVCGRGNVGFNQQILMDVDYIDRRNIMLDLKLMVLTVPAVILGRGAY